MKDRNTATTVTLVIIRSLKKGPFLKIEYLISTIDIKKAILPCLSMQLSNRKIAKYLYRYIST